jgi:tetratricopeptide (TPR) repeat protein
MWPRLAAGAATLTLALATGCAMMSEPPTQVTPAAPETYSLFGEPLYPAPLSAETRDTLEARLARAEAAHDRDPDDVEALIWLGRRTAYLGHHRAAVAIFSEGIPAHPDDPRLLRHRGHRYITLRRFESAVGDLEAAARLIAGRPDEVEPDGIPNARNTPTSTLHSNIWYHLGLAHYLRGDFERARQAYERCMESSNNPDQLCATTYWRWQTLVRLGRREEAERALEPIGGDLDLIENRDYHDLLMLYRGRVAADTLLASAMRRGGTALATIGYGVAGWRMARGEQAEAVALLRTVAQGDAWAAFGHIAAEADLHRLGERPQDGPR